MKAALALARFVLGVCAFFAPALVVAWLFWSLYRSSILAGCTGSVTFVATCAAWLWLSEENLL